MIVGKWPLLSILSIFFVSYLLSIDSTQMTIGGNDGVGFFYVQTMKGKMGPCWFKTAVAVGSH